MFTFRVGLKLCSDQTRVVFTSDELDEMLVSTKLTRRVLLANVARIFEPVGFLAPIILQ